jgi:hypothetical protein
MVEVIPAFARHETFHPRYGWLKKGYDAAVDSGVFLAENATTRLGVGKNMVRAIRFWVLAYKLCDEHKNADNPRLMDVNRSHFGDLMLGDSNGYDPYLEDPASLWLLHWMLLRPPCRAPAWWAVFNSPRSLMLTDEALTAELRRFCEERGWSDVADSSLTKDARCLLRMYGSVTQGRDLLEDSIDSPFTELDLIRPVSGERRRWTVNIGSKPGLPDAIVAYACLDYALVTRMTAKVIGLAGLARHPGAPGRAFALTQTALTEALGRFAQRHPRLISLTQAAGNTQLVLPDELRDTASEILDRHYRRTEGRIAA